MKKTFFLEIALLCLKSSSQAQMTAGLKIGLTESIWRVNENVGQLQLVTRGYIGIPIHFKIDDNFIWTTGAGFLIKGSNLDLSETINGTRLTAFAKTRLIYGEIPIGLQYNFQKDKGVFLNGGVAVSHAFSGHITAFAKFEDMEVKETEAFQFDGLVRRFDLGANFSVGYTFPIGTGKLALESRVQIEVRDISSAAAERLYNNNLLISVAYFPDF